MLSGAGGGAVEETGLYFSVGRALVCKGASGRLGLFVPGLTCLQ